MRILYLDVLLKFCQILYKRKKKILALKWETFRREDCLNLNLYVQSEVIRKLCVLGFGFFYHISMETENPMLYLTTALDRDNSHRGGRIETFCLSWVSQDWLQEVWWPQHFCPHSEKRIVQITKHWVRSADLSRGPGLNMNDERKAGWSWCCFGVRQVNISSTVPASCLSRVYQFKKKREKNSCLALSCKLAPVTERNHLQTLV